MRKSEKFTLTLVMIALLSVSGLITAQSQGVVTCNLRSQDTGTLLGQCVSEDWVRPVVLERPSGESDLIWTGGIYFEENTIPIHIGTYQYQSGPKLIAKFSAWYPLTEYSINSKGIRITWDFRNEAPPSSKDLKILKSASDLISNAEQWDRKDDRNCDNDDGKLSLYCALAMATKEYMGSYQHRQPAMQAVREVIQEKWRDRITSHRLMDFNNHPDTTLDDIRLLITLAINRLKPNIK